MNALGFVFCVLTVLSIGAIASHGKLIGSHRLRSSFSGHLVGNRAILNHAASEYYAALKKKPPESKGETEQDESQETSSLPDPPKINPDCARLNLTPLIEHGASDEPTLYEAAAKLLRFFYGEALFEQNKRAEYKFLDAFLKAARKQMTEESFSLEKLSFANKKRQGIYYQMLKGTKKGYPSLLDYIRLEPTASKICLSHAHPNLLAVYFTPKGAERLYARLHAPKSPPVNTEEIERICRDVHAPLLDPALLDLFDTQKSRHPKGGKSVVVAEDSESSVILRKKIILQGASGE